MITSTLYYATAEAAKAAARCVERNAPSAVIIDRTRKAVRW